MNSSKREQEIIINEIEGTIAEILENFERMEGIETSICGRIMSKRCMGKTSFFDISDRTGRIQVYVRMDDIGQEMYNATQRWDVGDSVGFVGEVFRTRRGDISIKATVATLLSKTGGF